MGLRKKRVDYYGVGTSYLMDSKDINPTGYGSRQDAIKAYIKDSSLLAGSGQRLDMVDYLHGRHQTNAMHKAWEKLYQHAKSGGYDAVGLPKEYDVSHRGDYYPVIPLVLTAHGNEAVEILSVPKTHSLAGLSMQVRQAIKLLGLDPDKFVKDIKQAISPDEFAHIQDLMVHLSVSIREEERLELPNERGSLAYVYHLLKSWHQQNKNERTVSYTIAQNHEHLSTQYQQLHKIKDKLIEQRTTVGRDVFAYDRLITDTAYDALPEAVKQMPTGAYYGHVIKTNNRYTLSQTLVIYHRTTPDNTKHAFEKQSIILEQNEEIRQNEWGMTAESGSWVVHQGWQAYGHNENTGDVIFPLDRQILSQFSPSEQERIVQESFRLSWTLKQTVKEYKDWVKGLVKVGQIAIQIIAINYQPQGSGLANRWVNYLSGAFLGRAVDKLIDHAVQVGWIDTNTAALLKVVSVGVGMAYTGDGFDFSRLMSAPNLMKLVNGSFDQYNKLKEQQLNHMVERLADEHTLHQNRMNELRKKEQELLTLTGVPKDAKLWLDTPSYLSKVDLFETVEMMYARHANTNVVSLSLGQVYHQSMMLHSGIYTPKRWVEPNVEVVAKILYAR